jgi:hypothetical protein
VSVEFCRYVRSLHPAETRLHFILENFSPHHGKHMHAGDYLTPKEVRQTWDDAQQQPLKLAA